MNLHIDASSFVIAGLVLYCIYVEIRFWFLSKLLTAVHAQGLKLEQLGERLAK